MKVDSNKRKRRSIRLRNHDYSLPGAYFITICTRNRECLFGEIAKGKTQFSEAGRVALNCWEAIPDHFPQMALDAFVVMPNHVHGIIVIKNENVSVGAKIRAAVYRGTPDRDMVRRRGEKFFAPTVERYGKPVVGPVPPVVHNVGVKIPLPQHTATHPCGTSKTIGSAIRGFKIGVTKWMRQNVGVHQVWQRNYYERIVRDARALNHIRKYIINNPARWSANRENPRGGGMGYGAT